MPILSNHRYFGPASSRADQKGTSYIIMLLQVYASKPVAIRLSNDASGAEDSSNQSKRLNSLVFRQPCWKQLELESRVVVFTLSRCIGSRSVFNELIRLTGENCITTSGRTIQHLIGQIYVSWVYGILQLACNQHVQFRSKHINIDTTNRKTNVCCFFW